MTALPSLNEAVRAALRRRSLLLLHFLMYGETACPLDRPCVPCLNDKGRMAGKNEP
jgi:hypothetical protein